MSKYYLLNKNLKLVKYPQEHYDPNIWKDGQLESAEELRDRKNCERVQRNTWSQDWDDAGLTTWSTWVKIGQWEFIWGGEQLNIGAIGVSKLRSF